MPDYQNQNNYTINLIGPDGKIVTIPPRARLQMSEFFDRYVRTGQLVKLTPLMFRTKSGIPLKSSFQLRDEENRLKRQAIEIKTPKQIQRRVTSQTTVPQRRSPVVGSPVRIDAKQAMSEITKGHSYPISNDIGIGILSYNRLGSLRRLVESIRKYTDLDRTTVFISDDASNDQDLRSYLSEISTVGDFVVLMNGIRLGVAGNSNRLLRCLARFSHMILLNDDVEIINSGWDSFYPSAALKTGLPHFIHQQSGVYGGVIGSAVDMNGVTLNRITEKPQGAILYMSHAGLNLTGYFDERYGLYGMEHVDWSTKAFEFGGGLSGFWDVAGSDKYMIVHPESSAVMGRSELLSNSKKLFGERKSVKLQPSVESVVPHVSYIIPFRNTGRTEAIRTIVNNVRAQRYPSIRIIMVEQDKESRIVRSDFRPVEHLLATAENPLFNKSLAFNLGVNQTSGTVILHDADTMAKSDYTTSVAMALSKHDGCHLGGRVIYADQASSALIASTGKVTPNVQIDRVVGYFEGGSLACSSEAYWQVGGFNESYWGYGCFAPGARVLMASGITKPIEEIVIGDIVVTHTGSVYPVTNTFRRHYDGDAYRLKVDQHTGQDLVVTSEHPILAAGKDQFYTKSGQQIKTKDYQPSIDWLPMSELTEGAFVSRRRSHNVIKDVSTIDVLEYLGHEGYVEKDGLVYPLRSMNGGGRGIDGSAIGCPRMLAVDNDLLDLIGYYAAEGCYSDKNGLRFTIHTKELEEGRMGAYIVAILTKFGLTPKIHPRQTPNSFDIQVFCAPLGRLIYSWFHGSKHQKRLPDWVMYLPPDKQVRVLAAILLGDGCINDVNIRINMGYRMLSEQTAFLAERTGSEVSCQPSKYSKRGYLTHRLQLSYSRCADNLLAILGIPSRVLQHQRHRNVGDRVLHKVRKLEKVTYSGPVYNFEVAEDHTYVIDHIDFHNCEDCDFFYRMSRTVKWTAPRNHDFLHLWHDRVSGWNTHHDVNKRLETELLAMPLQAYIAKQRDATAKYWRK